MSSSLLYHAFGLPEMGRAGVTSRLADSWQSTAFHGSEAGESVGKRERFKSLWGHDIWISWHAWQTGIRWQRVCVTFATNKRTSSVSM